MSTQCSGSSAALEKAEVHTESIQQPVQPLDLAPRGSQVVQLRPVRAYGTAQLAKSVGGPSAVGGLTAVGAPIISVNRPANLTILPSRPTAPQPVTQAISTYQIARVGNMRSATLTPGQQPASITVTPISASNFGANIRLTSATVSNGSWIQAGGGGQGSFTAPIRAAAITVGTRHVRPEQAKMIHLPQQGSVPQIAQLQMVDPKTSILKPSITTPLVNIRGTLQGGGNTAAQVLPIAPFTIRTTNLTNIPTIQQRPQTSTSTPVNQVQKVITQPASAPIQFVSASNKNVLQAITPLPRLNVNAAVCLLSTNANMAPNSSSPVASKPGTAGLIMTPSLTTGTGTGGMPLTKVIPVGRDGTSSIVDSLFAQSNVSTSNAVTVSAVSASGTQVSNSGQNISSASVVLASPSTSQGATNSSGSTQTQSHQLIHVQGPINVHHASPATAGVGVSLPTPNIASGNLAPSYFVEKNGNLSLVQTAQSRPIALEKRTSDGKSIPTGSMILTTQHPHLQSGAGQTATVTIPIGAQNVSFAHPISMTPTGGQHQIQSSAQIITTPISAQAHHIASTVLSTMSTTPTISVSAQSSQNTNIQPPPLGQCGPPHSIPTHVISQPSGTVSFSSASTTLSNVTVTNTVASSSVAVTNTSSTVASNSISVSVSLTSSNQTMTSTTSTTSNTANASTLSTAAPAQSPNTKSTTHSPRPTILRKQREINDNHIPARAQRNLTLQLNFAGNNTNSVPSAPPVSASVSSVTSAVTSANKENAGAMERGPPLNNSTSSSGSNNNNNPNNINSSSSNNNNNNSSNNNNNNNSSGLSILRKEFQPPNEESSWQSCSSHSSGSTTISATSETAEYQLNQPSSTSTLEVNLTPNCENTSSNLSLPANTTSPMSQNGVVRSITSGSHGKAHRNSSSKLQNKNIDRLKQEKEDCVSPRKKPRKQQLTSSDFLEAVSPEISFYQGRGKKFRRMENNIFDGYSNSKPGIEPPAEESTPSKVVCIIKKPRISLLTSTQTQLGKTRLNHFEHYSEVKAKEERRPTVSELANQKNIFSKVSGWKIQHMTNQMDQVVELEVSVVNSFNSLLTRLESKVGPNCPDRDINRILELLKGNIQRCKVIRDQMSDSRVQALKILDHKPRIVEVITKHMAKKPAKKKDRL